MTRGRVPSTTGQRIMDAYIEAYEDQYGKEYKPNYGMIASANKIAPYYKMPEIFKSIKWFIQNGGANFYKYINGIDSILEGIQFDIDEKERVANLLKDTKNLLNDIESQNIGKY